MLGSAEVWIRQRSHGPWALGAEPRQSRKGAKVRSGQRRCRRRGREASSAALLIWAVVLGAVAPQVEYGALIPSVGARSFSRVLGYPPI